MRIEIACSLCIRIGKGAYYYTHVKCVVKVGTTAMDVVTCSLNSLINEYTPLTYLEKNSISICSQFFISQVRNFSIMLAILLVITEKIPPIRLFWPSCVLRSSE